MRLAPYLGDSAYGAELLRGRGQAQTRSSPTPALANAARTAGVPARHRGARDRARPSRGAAFWSRTTRGAVHAGRVWRSRRPAGHRGARRATSSVPVPTKAEPLHMNVTEPIRADGRASRPACRAHDHPEAARQRGTSSSAGGWPARLSGEGPPVVERARVLSATSPSRRGSRRGSRRRASSAPGRASNTTAERRVD